MPEHSMGWWAGSDRCACGELLYEDDHNNVFCPARPDEPLRNIKSARERERFRERRKRQRD